MEAARWALLALFVVSGGSIYSEIAYFFAEGGLDLFFKRLDISESLMTWCQFLHTCLIYFIAKVFSELHVVIK